MTVALNLVSCVSQDIFLNTRPTQTISSILLWKFFRFSSFVSFLVLPKVLRQSLSKYIVFATVISYVSSLLQTATRSNIIAQGKRSATLGLEFGHLLIFYTYVVYIT